MTFEFEDHQLRLKERFARQARDYDDLQHEIADREVGRIGRFLPERVQNAEVAEKRRAERVRTISHLQALLQSDPAYAALYRQTEDSLASAERASETALEKAEARLAEVESAIDAMLARTAQLEDGRRVFKDAQGRVWTEGGELVAEDEAASIEWPPGAIGYETFKSLKDIAKRTRSDIDDIRRYQVDVLGLARDRMSDPDDPPSQDELNGIKRDIDAKMPEPVRQELPTELRPTPDNIPDMAPAKPSL